MLFLLDLRSKYNQTLPIVIFHQHLPVYGELSEVKGLPGDIPRVLAGLLQLLLLFARAEQTEARQ